MHKRNIKPVLLSSIAIFAIIFTLLYYSDTVPIGNFVKQDDKNVPEIASFEFNYTEANRMLKHEINAKGYNMSSPIMLSKKEDIQRWCEFFSDPKKQELIKHCSSTELKDRNNKFLGNIHMVGNKNKPQLVISVLETDSLSNSDHVETIFSSVVDTAVCECWEQIRPGNYTDIGKWITDLKEFHSNGEGNHSQTKVNLRGNVIQLELTSQNDRTYLWKLLISK